MNGKSNSNYIPPAKIASAGGVMINLSTIQGISAGGGKSSGYYINVTYIGGESAKLNTNYDSSKVLRELMSQVK